MPMTDLPLSQLADDLQSMESGESAEVPLALISQLAEEGCIPGPKAKQFAAENGCKLEGTLAPDSTIIFIRE